MHKLRIDYYQVKIFYIFYFFIFLYRKIKDISYSDVILLTKRFFRIYYPEIFGLIISAKFHKKVNHSYDKKYPYYIHLLLVYKKASSYINLLTEKEKRIAILACFGHDLIEDARLTYNDVVALFGVDVAEVIYCVTNEKGKNRKERANKKYYDGIKNNDIAVFVKLFDRYANIMYSHTTKSSMFDKYVSEHKNFEKSIYIPRFELIFNALKTQLNQYKNEKHY